MASKTITSSEDVFVNCPFDDEYAETFRALIFTILACGFRPRSARELDDGSETRIDKLYRIIEACRFGIHDVSRTDLDKTNKLPRFNMPLELGIFMGAKRFGGKKQSDKRVLIFDTEQHRYQKFISDIAGMDIHAHGGSSETAIIETRNWLANVSRRSLFGDKRLLNIYRQFQIALPALAHQLDLDVAHIPYVDFERIVAGWLVETNHTSPK